MDKLRTIILFVVAMATTTCRAGNTSRPWTFWYWMYGHVSKAGIRADLQAMKDVGLGGCYLMPIRGAEQAPDGLPPLDGAVAQQLTPRFWKMVDYAFAQADSLGLEMGLHVCDGFALAGGPWIRPEESMQHVVWSDTVVTLADTRRQTAIALPHPPAGNEYYEDIAVFAVSAWGDVGEPRVSGTIVREADGTFRSREAGYIQYDFDAPVTVRSLHVVPVGNNIQVQRLLTQVSNDGSTFTDLRRIAPARQGWQNTDEAYTYALPTTRASHYRFCWTPEGTPPGAEDMDAAKWSPVLKIKELTLSPEPVIDQYEAKNGSVWRIADSYAMTADGGDEYGNGPIRLEIANGAAIVPAAVARACGGRLRIVRFGHASTGHTNATAGGARGLECDKFSAEAVEKQVDSWFGSFMQRPHCQVVKYMHVDSWECGSQNWGRNFAMEFKARRGYDLLPFMPVYAGIPIDSTPQARALGLSSEQVLRDIRLTINDLLHDVFFTVVARKAGEYGVLLSCESVAPTMVADGMEHFRHADLPMGEFWLNSPTHDKPNDMLDAISGAHVYGKNIVQAEGFTEVRGVWDETPADVKTLLDRNLALGMNRLFFHVFTHNPYTDRRPGMTLDGIGLFFQRDQTWFPEAKGLVDYVARCQQLLQQGEPVVDIAVYTGNEMPRRSLTPDRIVPMLPGLFGQQRVLAEQQRQANEGCPMEESPVGVRHSANILDLKDWVNALHGYNYDSMNPDALLHRPFNYRVLVVPTDVLLTGEARQRIDTLRRQGVDVITEPYTKSTFENLPPDVLLPDSIAFCHRRQDSRDIYFLSNQQDSEQSFDAVFRCHPRDVMFYDPMANRYFIDVNDVIAADTLTVLRMTMKPRQSLFVLFGFDDITPQVTARWQAPMLGPDMPQPVFEWRLKGKWSLDFVESGKRLTSDTLFSWTTHSDPAIRFFSGHVRYKKTIHFKEKNTMGRTILSLGQVHNVAHVWLNGRDMGILWMAPYEVDVTSLMRQGDNTLEVEVVNTWHNALRGMDQGTPPYDGIWTNARYRTPGNSLLPAGLLGPVELRNER